MTSLFIKSSATISECGRYRFALSRTWDGRQPQDCWIMLNPSTADAHDDDPTIRRCMGFSQGWGAGGITVVNLFALRSTDPQALYSDPNPISPPPGDYNDVMISNASRHGGKTIAAWGVHGWIGGRNAAVMRLLANQSVYCLGVTKDGHPRHPLYVDGATRLIPYELAKVQS
jgi:hypothetical protein